MQNATAANNSQMNLNQQLGHLSPLFNFDRTGLPNNNSTNNNTNGSTNNNMLLNQLAALTNVNNNNMSMNSPVSRNDLHSRFNLVDLAAAAQVAASLQQQQQQQYSAHLHHQQLNQQHSK